MNLQSPRVIYLLTGLGLETDSWVLFLKSVNLNLACGCAAHVV